MSSDRPNGEELHAPNFRTTLRSMAAKPMSEPWDTLRLGMAAGTVIGTFLKLPALEGVEIAAANLDFAVVDLEHSQLGELEARCLIRHARALGFPTVVRVASADAERINRLLEAGAAGIQLSMVRRAESVRGLQAATQYAPRGSRSISLAHSSAGYGAVGLRDFLLSQGDGPLVIAQIETATTDDSLQEIAAARPDVLFVGPLDLTVDLGHDAERVRSRVAEIAAVAADAGVPLGGTGVGEHEVRYEVIGSDIALLRAAMTGMVQDRRTHARS